MSSLDPALRLEEALIFARAGRKFEAEHRLRQLVAEGSRLPRAAVALAVLCGDRGDRPQRRVWLRQARRLEEASGQPPSLRLLLNQLVDALEQGEPWEALAYGAEALTHYPDDGEAHLHHAEAALALGQQDDFQRHVDQARDSLRRLLSQDPGSASSWRMLARVEQRADRPDQAIEAFERALALDPNHVPTLLSMGRLLMNRGAIEAAMPWLMNALAVAPENAEVLSCNATALKAIGEVPQAIELFHQALAIDPALLEASIFLAGTLSDAGLLEEAATVYRQALDKTPGDRNCRLGLANTLRCIGNIDGSMALHRDLMEEDRTDLGSFSNWMFTTSVSETVRPADVLATARQFWEFNGVDNALPERPLPASVGDGERPLRVGLLSADIGDHVVGRFLDPLLRHHDPNRCRIDLISIRRLYDSASETLVPLADGFHSLEGLHTDQARALLLNQAYDLIVDTSGYTNGSGLHLLAQRCAPVQAHYIGYHATTGLSTIDGFIGDEETAAAELQDQFSEQLWRLPRPWLAYPSAASFPVATALMKTERPVLGSFCQVSKISDATLMIWAEVLRRVPDALLVLKNSALQERPMRERLEERFAALGIPANRLTFLAPVQAWWDHVDHYNVLDIALDTTPWSSATTGFEALAMGVPLVAIRGNSMASRMSSSLVKGMGKPEWAGGSPEAIADIVEALCADIPTLRKDKAARQQAVFAGPLFDGVELANRVMDLFASVVQEKRKN